MVKSQIDGKKEDEKTELRKVREETVSFMEGLR
jgi:hypothetical protein